MTSPDLNIVADENIPYVQDAFGPLGNVTCVPGRAIDASTIKNAQILLVRSVTKVTRELLKTSPIQFVGSATAGLDHIDSEYLQSRGVSFASAQGSNANSVAEYVITALLIIARRQGMILSEKSISIIGVGNIGRLVKDKAEALNMRVVLNDPPLAQQTRDTFYRPLEEALDCDVVTLHVPLTFQGPFQTFHLFNEDTLSQLKPSTIFINTSRGEVVETQCLLNGLKKRVPGATVLDVWEFEPHINWDLLNLVTLGTSHIAGYSLDGKAQGTHLIYQALCKHLDLTPTWSPSQSLPSPALPEIQVDPRGSSTEHILCDLATRIYDLEADHSQMAALFRLPTDKRILEFDRLRKHYPIRREFQNTKVKLAIGSAELESRIGGIGFKMEK